MAVVPTEPVKVVGMAVSSNPPKLRTRRTMGMPFLRAARETPLSHDWDWSAAVLSQVVQQVIARLVAVAAQPFQILSRHGTIGAARAPAPSIRVGRVGRKAPAPTRA